jgi:hypothetical protein
MRNLFYRQLAASGTLLMVLVFVANGGPCVAATTIGDPVALSTLVGNASASVVAGDKRFANFSYSRAGDMPAATAIDVVPIRDDDGSFGIRIQGSFNDSPAAGSSDALITYQASVTDPQFRMIGARLSGNPFLSNSAGSINATETFLPLGPSGEYTMEIYADQSLLTRTDDSVTFASSVAMLNVQTGIVAMGNGISVAGLSVMDEVFVQEALSPDVSGDYNYDHVVNAVDYTVWRNTLGQSVAAGSGADGSGPGGTPNGVVESFDYDFWKGRFGAPSGSGGGASLANAPEPTSLLLVGAALSIALCLRRRRA